MLAQILTQTSAPATNWTSIASSADGTRLVAGNGTGIWISTNSGNSWTQTTAPASSWVSVASSADGSQLAAVASRAFAGPLVLSTNAGLTWLTNNIGNQVWASIVSSGDGKTLVATVKNGPIYCSADSGVTWSQGMVSNSTGGATFTAPWQSLAASADGKFFVVINAFTSGGIFASTNSGVTWTAINFDGQMWRAIASSANGRRLVAECVGGAIYFSINSGAIWTSLYVPNQNSGSHVVASADGTKLVALISDGRVYSSTNSGLFWTSNNFNGVSWGATTCSADGNTIYAVQTAGNSSTIWSQKTISSPVLNLARMDNATVISWILLPRQVFYCNRVLI